MKWVSLLLERMQLKGRKKNGTVRSLSFDCVVGVWYLCYLQLCELCIIDRCIKG